MMNVYTMMTKMVHMQLEVIYLSPFSVCPFWFSGTEKMNVISVFRTETERMDIQKIQI